MILVTSASYVNQELQNEFGKIPPAFLPLKNKDYSNIIILIPLKKSYLFHYLVITFYLIGIKLI